MKFPKLSDIKNLDDLKKIGADLAGQALSTVDGFTKPAANLTTPIDEQLKDYETALNAYAELFEKQKEAFTALKRNYEVLKASVGVHLGKSVETPTSTEASTLNAETTEIKEEEKH